MSQFEEKKGIALILTLIILVALSIIAFAFLTMTSYEIKSVGGELRNMQAFYIAEAGRAKARWALIAGEQTVPWTESDTVLGSGMFTVSASDDKGDGSTTTITSNGYIPDDTKPIAQRQVVEADITIGPGDLTNFSLGAVISASSQKLPHNPATNANDGSAGTSWKASVKGNAWLKLNFGSLITFNRVIYTGNNINSFEIEHSNNDSTWSAVTGAVESPAGTVNFNSVLARYLRFNMVVDSKRTAQVNELETYNSDEEKEAALGQGKFSTSW